MLLRSTLPRSCCGAEEAPAVDRADKTVTGKGPSFPRTRQMLETGSFLSSDKFFDVHVDK